MNEPRTVIIQTFENLCEMLHEYVAFFRSGMLPSDVEDKINFGGRSAFQPGKGYFGGYLSGLMVSFYPESEWPGDFFLHFDKNQSDKICKFAKIFTEELLESRFTMKEYGFLDSYKYLSESFRYFQKTKGKYIGKGSRDFSKEAAQYELFILTLTEVIDALSKKGDESSTANKNSDVAVDDYKMIQKFKGNRGLSFQGSTGTMDPDQEIELFVKLRRIIYKDFIDNGCKIRSNDISYNHSFSGRDQDNWCYRYKYNLVTDKGVITFECDSPVNDNKMRQNVTLTLTNDSGSLGMSAICFYKKYQMNSKNFFSDLVLIEIINELKTLESNKAAEIAEEQKKGLSNVLNDL